jgi:hypothetical protein
VLFVSAPVSYTVIKLTPSSTNPDGDFLLRWNRNGTFDLICFRCWLTIGTTLPGSDSDPDLKALRQDLARFIISDLTDPSSVSHELAIIIPGTVVPVQTILLDAQREYAMFADLKRRYHWVLEPYQYESQNSLLQHLEDDVIRPAEAKVTELTRR